MGEAKRHDNSNQQVKCARAGCSRTSRNSESIGLGHRYGRLHRAGAGTGRIL